MRRPVALLAFAVLLAAPAMLPAASRADLDRLIDLSVTLKSLSQAVENGASLPAGRMVLLSGTVSDVNIVNKDPAGFKVRIELITGEWIGMDDVKAYSCYVEFTGPDYVRMFPARPPREATPGVIAMNSRVVLIGRVTGTTTTPLGGTHALVDGAYIRSLQ